MRTRPDQGAVGQVGQDAQEDPAIGDGFDQGGNPFAHGVDQVGPHGITGIDQQVQTTTMSPPGPWDG
jgi:hypothetical protein